MKKLLIITVFFIMLFATDVYADTYYGQNAEGTSGLPSGERIVCDTEGTAHPRILANADTFSKINDMLRYDFTLNKMYSSMIDRADSYLTQECVRYGLEDNIRMLNPIKQSGEIIFTTAFAYRLTGEEKYAERAWTETKYFCTKWSDWNPYQMLGVGEAMFNCAIAYDWLYDYLDSDQKEVIRTAIQDRAWRHYYNDVNGLTVSNNASGREHTPYESDDEELIRSSLWRNYTRANNWWLVINGGVITSALAVCDELPEESQKILDIAMNDTERSLEGYAPDGAWYEGISYWDYATEYLVDIISSLESSCGTDYGIGDYRGLSNTADYFFALDGPGGRFNFSDCSAETSTTEDLLWLANKYNLPHIAARVYDYYSSNGKIPAARGMLWYVNMPNREYDNHIWSDEYFRGIETVALRRETETASDFIAIHGGKNSDPHAHIDSGTFILDSQGERFAMDLGADNYNIDGGLYAYRNSGQGHNIIVFDPVNSDYGQTKENNAQIKKFKTSNTDAFAVCDLTDSYSSGYVISYVRGIRLFNGKKQYLIQDEFTATDTIPELYWFMHTDADIQLAEDGKSAVLTKNGKTLNVKIVSDINGCFEIMEPLGISGTKTAEYDGQEGQYSNEGIRKLAIHMENVTGETTISVLAYYGDSYEYAAAPISDWDTAMEELPCLWAVDIDGVPLDGFDKDKTQYEYTADRIPSISARGNGETAVLMPDNLNAYAYIFVSNSRGTKTYKIYVKSKASDIERLYTDFVNNANKRTCDGDEATYADFKCCSLIYDIGYTANTTGIALSAISDDNIRLYVSEDGYSYYEVYNGECPTDYQKVVNENIGFRYIKLVCDSDIRINEIGVDLTSGEKGYDVIMVHYDKDGMLTNVQTTSIPLTLGEKYTFSDVVNENDEFVRVYIWDAERAYPITEWCELLRQSQ